MGGLSVNFSGKEIQSQNFKSVHKAKAWQEASGVMDKINSLTQDAVTLDNTDADKNRLSNDILLLNRKTASGEVYSAHIKIDGDSGQIVSAQFETDKSLLSLITACPKAVYSERIKGEAIEKRLEVDYSKGNADFKHLLGASKDEQFPGKGYTIKADQKDNFASIGQAKAYERGLEIKEQVENLGKSLTGLDGVEGVDRNPEKGFVKLYDTEDMNNGGQVKFNVKSGDLEMVNVKQDGVRFKKTVNKDHVNYSRTSELGQEIFTEYNKTGDSQYNIR